MTDYRIWKENSLYGESNIYPELKRKTAVFLVTQTVKHRFQLQIHIMKLKHTNPIYFFHSFVGIELFQAQYLFYF